MDQVKIDDLASQAETLMKRVERGEVFIITKGGRPIAELHPLKKKKPSWKREIKKITLPAGVSAQAFIEEERDLK